MKNNFYICTNLMTGLSIFVLHSAIAQQTPAPSTNKPPQVAIVYRAAKGSAPEARVTGGSRGGGDASVSLDVLLPDQDGLTISPTPSLFWYQSKPSPAKFELTLLEPNQPKPLLKIEADHADKSGIQRLRLADHGVELTPGVEYQWVIALVTDPDNRSSDLVASGFIKCVEPPAGLKEQLAKAEPGTLPSTYAGAGIWVDALASLSDSIDAQPDDQDLRAERAGLLRQVGLNKAAETDSVPRQ